MATEASLSRERSLQSLNISHIPNDWNMCLLSTFPRSAGKMIEEPLYERLFSWERKLGKLLSHSPAVEKRRNFSARSKNAIENQWTSRIQLVMKDACVALRPENHKLFVVVLIGNHNIRQ